MRGSRKPSSYLRATQRLRASWTRWRRSLTERRLVRTERRKELLLLEVDHLTQKQERLRARLLPPTPPPSPEPQTPEQRLAELTSLPMALPPVQFPQPEEQPLPQPEEQPLPPAEDQLRDLLKLQP